MFWASNHKNTNQASNQKMTSKIGNVIDFIKLKNQNSPWGQWNGNNTKPNKDPRNGQSQKLNPTTQDEIDQAFKKSKEFLKNLFGGGGNNSNNPNSNLNNKTPNSIFGLILMALVVIWLASGIYKVDSNQNGLVLYFGKFYSIATPGLNYHLPAPFGEVIRENVTDVNTDEFGFSTESSKFFGKKTKDATINNSESLMLTGDENIVDIDFQVQCKLVILKILFLISKSQSWQSERPQRVQ